MKNIKITDLSFFYKYGKPVFSNFNLILNQEENKGKVTAIMGSSGSGKSTLMKLLLGIEKPNSGTIDLYPENPIISYVPQEPVLFEHLSIEQNARYFQFAGAYKSRFNESLFKELVTSLGLEELMKVSRSVAEMSGGQKQRFSLLRALSIEPDFLILDEPSNGLDAEVKVSFLNKLREISERLSLHVLYITHHKLEAQLIADEVVYLVCSNNDGAVKKAVQGRISEFIDRPPVLDAAHVFRFPELKLLPVHLHENGSFLLAENEEMLTHYLMIDTADLVISDPDGYAFKVISKTSVYTVIRNYFIESDWMIPTQMTEQFKIGQIITIGIKGKPILYNKMGTIV